MCCGCTGAQAFNVVGAILINFSFAALISWGTAVLWPLGLALSLAYALFLYLAAGWLSKHKMPVTATVDLALLLFCIAVGVSGSILAYNVVGCGTPYNPAYTGDSTMWVFPTSATSDPQVVGWASQNKWDSGSRATFAFEPAASAVLFSARNGTGHDDGVWLTAPSAPEPTRLVSSLKSPSSFVALPTSSLVCFAAYEDSGGSGGSGGSAIHCAHPSTGSVRRLEGAHPLVNPSSLLVASDGTLWFKADPPFGGVSVPAGVAYKAGPSDGFATAALVSQPSGGTTSFPSPPPPNAPGAGGALPACDSIEGFRMRAVAFLFLAVVPSVLAVALIAIKRRAASMAFGAYAGAFALVINVFAIFEPAGRGAFELIKYYHAIGGACWLGALVGLKLSGRVAQPGVLTWGLNTGVLAFFAAMHACTEVPITSSVLGWLLYNLLVVIPLLLLAVICTDLPSAAGLPLLFASAGVLMDTWKVADELTKLVTDASLRMFIRFLTLGTIGVGVVGAGVVYNRHKAQVASRVDELARLACAPCRRNNPGGGDVAEQQQAQEVKAVTGDV